MESTTSSGEDEGNIEIRDTDRISMSKSFPRRASPSKSKITVEEEPESPGSSSSSRDDGITRQSASEGDSSSSEGVLVEHPLNPDQDSRSHGDPESGVLVNIDGSMREGDQESEDGGREDTFVDAPEDLGFPDGRSSVGLDHPIVLVDIDQRNEISQLTTRLEATAAECAKYKEEKEEHQRELVSLYQELRSMVNYSAGITEDYGVDDTLISSPVNSVLIGCSNLASHLKINMHEQRVQIENYVRAREEEIEVLNLKIFESSMSHDIVSSYLSAIREEQLEYQKQTNERFLEKMLYLTSVITLDDGVIDGFSLIEKRTIELVERYSENLSEAHQLGQCLSNLGSDFKISHPQDLRIVFDSARRELLEGKHKEKYYLETIDELRHEKDTIYEQLNQTKALLEQADSKFRTAKEKLGMAVTKGKSLVQQRDALKQLLSEKTAELEKCTADLHARAEELNKNEVMLVSIQNSLSDQNAFQIELEEVLAQVEYPMDWKLMKAVDRIKWFIQQKHIADEDIQRYDRLKGLLSSADLPEAMLSSDSESQLKWLLSSFSESEEHLKKLQAELSSLESAQASYESQLQESEKKIEILTASISEEKAEVNSLKIINQELISKCNVIGEETLRISSERNQLMNGLLVISEITEGASLLGGDRLIEVCLGKVSEWKRVAHESSFYPELFQDLQCLLVLKEMDLALLGMIMEEENISKTALSNQLTSLRDEKNDLKKELDRVEERYSLIREKLSLAVKKGKGLLQDRDSLKLSLDEKNSEIETLKQDLLGQESEASKLKEQIEVLKQFEIETFSLREEREKLEKLFQERDDSFNEMISAIDSISLPGSSTAWDPSEKLKIVSNYIPEIENVKSLMNQDLEKSKAEVISLVGNLAHASSTIKDLEKVISEMEANVSTHLEEKENAMLGKVSAEKELETVKKDVGSLMKDIEKLSAETKVMRQNEIEIVSLREEREKLEKLLQERNYSLNEVISAIDSISLPENLTSQDPAEKLKIISNYILEIENVKSSMNQDLERSKAEVLSLAGDLAHASSTIKDLEKVVSEMEKNFSTHSEEKENAMVGKVSAEKELETMKKDVGSLMKEIENLNTEVRVLKQLEIETVSLKEEREKLKELLQEKNHSLNEVVSAVDEISLPENLTFASRREKLKIISNYIHEIENAKSLMNEDLERSKAEVLSLTVDLAHASSTIRDLENALSEMERNFSTHIEEKEDVKLGKVSAEKELKIVKKDVDSLTEKLTQSYATIKNLEGALLEAENSISILTHQKMEIEVKSKEENMLLSTRLVTCEDELSDAQRRIHNQSDELATHLRNIEDGLSFMMGEEFMKTFDYLQNLGVLVSKVCDKVSESEAEARPVSEQDSHFLKPFSIDPLVNASGTQANILMERFRNFSGRIDENISLLSQALQTVLNNVDRVVDRRQKQEENLKEQKLKVLDLQNNMTLLLSACKKASHNLLVEFDDSLRESESSDQDVCDSVAAKLLDAVDRTKLETQKFSVFKSIPEDQLDILFDRLKFTEIPFRELEIETESYSSPIGKMLYILDNVSRFQNLVNSMIQEKEEMQASLQQFREAYESYGLISQNLSNLHTALEKVILKLGGIGFLESMKNVDARELVHHLDRLVMGSLQESETLKSKVQELGSKLLETQALNENLVSRIQSLEDSTSDIGKERTSSEGSSAVTGPEIVEIEDLAHLGKKNSFGWACGRNEDNTEGIERE